MCDLDEYDVAMAMTEAVSNQVELTLSVPCFEVWLILHKSEKCPGLNSAAQAGKYLEKLVPGWDKRSLRFDDFRDGVTEAITRARRLGDPPAANPSTAVWKLVESLRAH